METQRKTLFTTVVWYSHKPDGITPYTWHEKQAGKNLRWHPSFDYEETTDGATITTHHKSWEKIIKYLTRKRKIIITAFVETEIDGEVMHVCKVTQGEFSIYAKPVFVAGKGPHDIVLHHWNGKPRKKPGRREAA